jgi:hypothetical protein
LQNDGVFTTTPSDLTLRWATDHSLRSEADLNRQRAWRSGNRYALPTSPHPRRGLSEIRDKARYTNNPTGTYDRSGQQTLIAE